MGPTEIGSVNAPSRLRLGSDATLLRSMSTVRVFLPVFVDPNAYLLRFSAFQCFPVSFLLLRFLIVLQLVKLVIVP